MCSSDLEYFERIFPLNTTKEQTEGVKKLSKNASMALNVIDTQPGAEFAQGSWWSAFNTVTYMTDHVIGRSDDSRLASAWYGQNKILKTKALELAVEMANVA